MSPLAKVFELDWKELNVPRAVAVVVVLGAVVIVLEVIDQQKYVITVVFAALFVGVTDPGGEFGNGVARMGAFAVTGPLLTLLGFAVGGAGWGSSCLPRLSLRCWPARRSNTARAGLSMGFCSAPGS